MAGRLARAQPARPNTSSRGQPPARSPCRSGARPRLRPHAARQCVDSLPQAISASIDPCILASSEPSALGCRVRSRDPALRLRQGPGPRLGLLDGRRLPVARAAAARSQGRGQEQGNDGRVAAFSRVRASGRAAVFANWPCRYPIPRARCIVSVSSSNPAMETSGSRAGAAIHHDVAVDVHHARMVEQHEDRATVSAIDITRPITAKQK